jgi:hypothetical protein
MLQFLKRNGCRCKTGSSDLHEFVVHGSKFVFISKFSYSIPLQFFFHMQQLLLAKMHYSSRIFYCEPNLFINKQIEQDLLCTTNALYFKFYPQR